MGMAEKLISHVNDDFQRNNNTCSFQSFISDNTRTYTLEWK